ncbi:uncharacterized protein EAE97_011757 [Botrytis byssoidea]|uniref:Secreted protein n=1 Tax=Botrytis byssoidea TaxID=139641 RepID=A0A9P5HTQ4_9HELO|nr:uncharacterized protein EAE97_011757 [Botrytis byssoidea]KAF7919041.1 hypothetical protein EAE97_011757 [Botrytis byssoidea]
MLRFKAASIVTFLLPLLQHPHITPSALFPATLPPPAFFLYPELDVSITVVNLLRGKVSTPRILGTATTT